MDIIYAATMPSAIPAICRVLREVTQVAVLCEGTGEGFYASLKMPAKDGEYTEYQVRRYVAMKRDPQPHHVELRPWPAYQYRGYSKGEKSSAL
jgi:hypothetical protein